MGCARAWRDAGRLYASLVPEVIHEPAAEGLAEWFEESIAEADAAADENTLWLVAAAADASGTIEVAGLVEATVAAARPDGRWQLQRDLSRTRLLVNALAVADGHRRLGVGTALLTAAEEWGRRRGAEVALTDTNLHSPQSVPFYEQRMGYSRQALVLRKMLG